MDQQSNFQGKRVLGEQEDLERALDHDEEEEVRDLKTKVLFAIQGLGGIRTVQENRLTAYIRGQHCQQSIKDLVKMIRKDLEVNPRVKLILGPYNIFESDLIDLLILQLEDKKLSFWLIALMTMMTTAPSPELDEQEKKTILEALRNYKKALLRHQSLYSLTIHIADYFTTPVPNRLKAHYQMMQFIILLIRNILQIQSDPENDEQLHSNFIVAMFKEEIFEPLLYLLQTEKGPLMSKIKIPLIEIFYYTFTCLSPESLFPQNIPYIKSMTKKSNTPVRHSRFMPSFKFKSETGIQRITHNLTKKQETTHQRKEPLKVAQLKKVTKIKLDYVKQNFLSMEVDFHERQQKPVKTILQIAYQYSQEFIQVQFSILCELVFDAIYKQIEIVSQHNVIQYMLLCSWALQMVRCKYLKCLNQAKTVQEKGSVEFDLANIACVMQNSHFELIYKNLLREVTREKKKDFQINSFHASLSLFLKYIEVIDDISQSYNATDRKNANVLMANMFRHDIARIFKIGFLWITHEGILKLLIVITHKFFKLLSSYSQGKVLTIQINRLLKKKKNTKQENQQEEIQDFISHDSQDEENGQQSYKQNNQEKQTKKEKSKKKQEPQPNDQPMFQERKFNEISQFAMIAQYDIISKYLIFLKNQGYKQNTKEFNGSIFFYFQKIITLLKGQWLFFQAETLLVFQQILADTQFLRANQSFAKIVTVICRDFIKLLKINQLALVESLFRYSSLRTKERIMNNYQNEEQIEVVAQDAPRQNNMFHEHNSD